MGKRKRIRRVFRVIVEELETEVIDDPAETKPPQQTRWMDRKRVIRTKPDANGTIYETIALPRR